jgi:hypothetical protein
VVLDKLRTVRHTFMRRLRGPTLLSFGHVTEGGVAAAGSNGVIIIGAGVGSDGVIGAGAGFGVRFLAFALLAGFAFFNFFAIFNLPIRITKLCNTGHAVAAYLNLCTAV